MCQKLSFLGSLALVIWHGNVFIFSILFVMETSAQALRMWEFRRILKMPKSDRLTRLDVLYHHRNIC